MRLALATERRLPEAKNARCILEVSRQLLTERHHPALVQSIDRGHRERCAELHQAFHDSSVQRRILRLDRAREAQRIERLDPG